MKSQGMKNSLKTPLRLENQEGVMMSIGSFFSSLPGLKAGATRM
jgi:hypothetical protein